MFTTTDTLVYNSGFWLRIRRLLKDFFYPIDRHWSKNKAFRSKDKLKLTQNNSWFQNRYISTRLLVPVTRFAPSVRLWRFNGWTQAHLGYFVDRIRNFKTSFLSFRWQITRRYYKIWLVLFVDAFKRTFQSGHIKVFLRILHLVKKLFLSRAINLNTIRVHCYPLAFTLKFEYRF